MEYVVSKDEKPSGPFHKGGWLKRLPNLIQAKQDQAIRADDDGDFDVPEPTLVVGSYTEGLQPNQPPAGPSQAEINHRVLIREALAIEDPWAGPTPPLYSSGSKRK